MIPKKVDTTDTFGANTISSGYTVANAFFAELCFTFLLCFVYFQTAIDPASITRMGYNTVRNGRQQTNNPVAAPLAIGFAYFVAHLILGPITGASLNPARSIASIIPASIRQ